MSKTDSRKLSSLFIGSFFDMANFFEANEHFFSRNLNHHCKCREQKENF